MCSSRFSSFDNKDYQKHSITHKDLHLIHKLRKTTSDSPWVVFDIIRLIQDHCPIWQKMSKEDAKYIISDAVTYFHKSDVESIYKEFMTVQGEGIIL